MAVNIIKIPKLNPIQFYELDRQQTDARYNTFPILEDLHWFSIKSYEAKKPYLQKWQYNDKVEFQIHTSKTFVPKILLIDRFRREYHSWNMPSMYNIAGNIGNHNGVDFQLYTSHFKFSFSDALGISDGIYWLKLEVPIDTISGGVAESAIEYISDPIYLAAQHNDTLLLEYKHKTNKYGVIFQQTKAKFSIRIPGSINEFEPVSSDTSYKDQVEKVSYLSSFPSELYKLFIGGATGITDHIYNILNRAFSCSEIYADGMGIVKEESVKWETTRTTRNSLKWCSIQIRKKSNDYSTSKTAGASLLLFTRNSGPTPHYYVHTVSFTNGTTTITLPSSPVLNSVQEANYINNLSGIFSAINALTGFFSVSGNDFLYTPGIGESYYEVSESIVFTRCFSLSKLVSIGATSLEIYMDGITSGDKMGVVWDEAYNVFNNYTFSVSGLNMISKTYLLDAINNNKSIHVFHADSIGSLTIDSIANLAGNLPASLVEIDLTNYKSSILNFSIFEECRTTITTVRVSGELIDINLVLPLYSTLLYLDFRNNKLTQAAVQYFLSSIKNAADIAPGMYGGILSIENQTPPATLTVLANLWKSVLVNTHGWTITND